MDRHRPTRRTHHQRSRGGRDERRRFSGSGRFAEQSHRVGPAEIVPALLERGTDPQRARGPGVENRLRAERSPRATRADDRRIGSPRAIEHHQFAPLPPLAINDGQLVPCIQGDGACTAARNGMPFDVRRQDGKAGNQHRSPLQRSGRNARVEITSTMFLCPSDALARSVHARRIWIGIAFDMRRPVKPMDHIRSKSLFLQRAAALMGHLILTGHFILVSMNGSRRSETAVVLGAPHTASRAGLNQGRNQGVDNELTALGIIFTEFYYWLTVVLMFFIHVGFCMYEVGASRHKNHMHTLMKNTMLIPLVTITFFFFGWWIYFAFPNGPGIIGGLVEAPHAVAWSEVMGAHMGGADDLENGWARINGVFWPHSCCSRGPRPRSCRARSSNASSRPDSGFSRSASVRCSGSSTPRGDGTRKAGWSSYWATTTPMPVG